MSRKQKKINIKYIKYNNNSNVDLNDKSDKKE